MERENRFRQVLLLVVMTCAGLFCVVGLLPAVLGPQPVGIIYALMGAVLALLTKKIADRQRAQRELMNRNAELEQRVRERTAQLDAANKGLESFSYSVAHDLRGPLQQLSGFVELLQPRALASLDEDSIQYLGFIKQSVWRMSGLIDDLLDFSRAERVDLQKGMVSLEEVVNEARHELRHKTKSGDIVWTIGPLPEVYADRSLLLLAIVNLLSNAIKFTRGKTQAEIEMGSTLDDQDIVVFVRDNGVGFDMKDVDKLFGAFQRLHANHEFEGTGIGLSNVQRIIQRHGGRTWAEGSVDGGATFWFSLPRTQSIERQEHAKAQAGG